jgi:hypothetical protein
VFGAVRHIIRSNFLWVANFEIDDFFVNADGFGITWHTDARSTIIPRLNAILPQPTPRPRDVGPRPAQYKTVIAKPWVLLAFLVLSHSLFFLSGSMIRFSTRCAKMFYPRRFVPTFELQLTLRLQPPTTTRSFSGVTALCTTGIYKASKRL